MPKRREKTDIQTLGNIGPAVVALISSIVFFIVALYAWSVIASLIQSVAEAHEEVQTYLNNASKLSPGEGDIADMLPTGGTLDYFLDPDTLKRVTYVWDIVGFTIPILMALLNILSASACFAAQWENEPRTKEEKSRAFRFRGLRQKSKEPSSKLLSFSW